MQHSPLSGSQSDRFINCPGSVQLIQSIRSGEEPEEEPDYRRDGIVAHEIAAQCLKTDKGAHSFVGDERYPFFDIAHAEAVQVYLDYVREARHGNLLKIEHTSGEGLFRGTLDCSWTEGFCAVIVDYKHGEGLAVDVVDNRQLLYYAALMLREHPEIVAFELVIVQPRAYHRDGPIRMWIGTTANDVRCWYRDVLVPAMEAAQQINAPLKPGSWCRFCPAKLVCPALQGMSQAVAVLAKAEQLPAMSNDQLGYEYQLIKVAEMYFNAISAETMKRALRGEKIPGVKVVRKTGYREWKKDAPFEDYMYERKVMTPAQFEKWGGRDDPIVSKFIKDWAYVPDKGFTIATDDDKRQEAMIAIPHWAVDKDAM